MLDGHDADLVTLSQPCPPISALRPDSQVPLIACRNSGNRQPIRFAWLEVTPHCNLRCVHCYADSGPHRNGPTKMQEADWLSVLRMLREEGCSTIQLIGGEPMLHPSFRTMVKCARDLGFDRLEVFTNGTALTESNVSFLSHSNVHLAVSLYSHRQDVHDRLVGVTGAWRRTVDGMRRAAASMPVHCAIIGVEPNIDRSRIAEFLRTIGVTDASFHEMLAAGRATDIAGHRRSSCGHCGHGRVAFGYDGLVRPCVFQRQVILGKVEDYRAAAPATS